MSKVCNRAALTLFLATTTLSAMTFVPPAMAGVPGSTSSVNVDGNGLALKGYDPVAYFDSGKPTPGKPDLSASYGGVTYLFATTEHRAKFIASPAQYLPEFGGFCAVGTSFGEKVDTDPNTGEVVNGKLYLQNGPRALELFHEDRPGTIDRANENWPDVKDKAF